MKRIITVFLFVCCCLILLLSGCGGGGGGAAPSIPGLSAKWSKTFGGQDSDSARSVSQTADGGYIVAGNTQNSTNGSDIWVLKLDGAGNSQWDRKFGGLEDDYANSIQQTNDGGYIVAGYAELFGAGNDDVWVLKLDGAGSLQWAKTFGGVYQDSASSVRQTSENGYIIAGSKGISSAGNSDLWVIKLDNAGNQQWEKALVPYQSNLAIFAQDIFDQPLKAFGHNAFRVVSLKSDFLTSYN